MRFELTVVLSTSVFKTDTISQTLPTIHKEGNIGFLPNIPIRGISETDLQGLLHYLLDTLRHLLWSRTTLPPSRALLPLHQDSVRFLFPSLRAVKPHVGLSHNTQGLE